MDSRHGETSDMTPPELTDDTHKDAVYELYEAACVLKHNATMVDTALPDKTSQGYLRRAIVAYGGLALQLLHLHTILELQPIQLRTLHALLGQATSTLIEALNRERMGRGVARGQLRKMREALDK